MNDTALGIAAPNMPPFSFKVCVCVPPLASRAPAGDPPTCTKSPLSLRVCKPLVPNPAQSAQSGRNPSLTRHLNGRKPFHSPIAPLSALTPYAHHRRQPLNPALPDPLAACPNPVGLAVPPSRLTRPFRSTSPPSPLPPLPRPVENRRILGAEAQYHHHHYHRDDRRSATSPLSTFPVTPLGTDSAPLVGWDRD